MARKVNVGAMVAHDVFKLDTPDMQVVQIPLSQLIVNEHNFFTVEDVQELADDIELNGLYSPLTVCAAGEGKYRIVAGHRRRKALELLGRKDAPCIVKSYDGEDSELVALIQSNLTSRELTYYEKMQAVVLLEKALRSMKERGVELPGRLRDHLAEQVSESASAVHRMQYIHKNLSPALLDALRREQIGESVADELAHSPQKVQTEFEQRLARGETFRAQDVKAARDKPTVSDGVVDAFLLRHIAEGCETGLYRVLHNSQHMAAIQLIPEVKDALHYYGYQGFSSEGVWYDFNGSGMEVKKPFQGKLSWSQIVQRLRGMVESGKIAPPADEPEDEPEDAPAPEAQALRQLDEQMQQAVAEPQQVNGNGHVCVTGLNPYGVCGAAQCCDEPHACCIACPEPCNSHCGFLPKERITVNKVWHPYPAEEPDEGQTVLTLTHNNELNVNTYDVYVYREGAWYLPDIPLDVETEVDVRWWSAELPPEEVK
ncbi:ParB/RepB/Spo0J family partition protein [uncultured Agathobaculum sp.]|uniref:ParB/RepB/Spo0J family partition protein n=1 Tax=uncultured Agathobaculum sp. TaxID=2048140 RepID=UPI0032099977